MENEEDSDNDSKNEKIDQYKYGTSFANQGIKNEEKYYDIIIDIDSIKKLFKKGWDIIYTEEGDKKYEQKKNENLTVVAVIGNKNRGKSYILQKISGKKLPLGYSVTTKGISIKYPDNMNQNIILLDSAGFEVPLLEIPGVYEFEIKDEKKKKEYKDKLNELREKMKKSTNDEKNVENYKLELADWISKKINFLDFKEKSVQIASFTKDRRLTDYFLQKFILWNSDILICVVGQLTFSDQKFINTIRSQLNNKKKKKLFIIHNLTTFVFKKQVEEYIEKTLMNSYTFDLEKIQIPKFGEKNEKENQFYWREKNINNNNNIDIIHLVMANDDDNSEAGNYYNESTIEYIKRQIMAYVDYTKFDIKEIFKNFLAEISNEILEKNIIPDDILINGNKIKVKENYKDEDIKLKDCLIDELGTNTFVASTYKPKHRRYKTKIKDENFYVIEIEIPGGAQSLTSKLENKVGNNIITIKGERKNLKDGKDESFELDIKIPLDQVHLDKFLNERTEKKGGIYKIFYSIIEDSNDSENVSLVNESSEEKDDGSDDNDNDDDDDDDDDDNDNDNNDNDNDNDNDDKDDKDHDDDKDDDDNKDDDDKDNKEDSDEDKNNNINNKKENEITKENENDKESDNSDDED